MGNVSQNRLRTVLSDLLQIQVPIVNAPMTPAAGGQLAAAVSDAGGFGMLGFDEDEDEQSLTAQLDFLRCGRERTFGIGLAAWVLEARPSLLDLAIAAHPRMISISFGNPAPYADRIHSAGILLAAQVQNRKWAQVALDAGADLLVAQGTEAGGHTGSVGTLPLLQLVLKMTDKPVLAAGGIASGRGMIAVLAAGAAGVWIGTPFLAALESRSTAKVRERIIAADETQTVHTHVFDLAQSKPWPAEFPGRALRNAFTDRWHGNETALTISPEAIVDYREAKFEQDYTRAHIYAGQSVGFVQKLESARDIIDRLERDARAHLKRFLSLLT